MAHSLFAERFVSVESDDGPEELAVYDEGRNYNVTSAGHPYVETHTIASTNTFTKVNAEPGDADRSAWESVFSVGCRPRTRATRGRGYW
jgi:hypothetical protein